MMKGGIISFLLILLFIVSSVNAQEEGIGFKLELYYGDGKPVIDPNYVDVSKTLMLKFTVINVFDYWVRIDNIDNGLSCKFEGEIKKECFEKSNYEDIWLLIPPKESKEFFIHFDKYNSLKTSERMGDWKIEYDSSLPIEPRSYYYNIDICFESGSLEGIKNCDIVAIPANNLKFTVVSETPSAKGSGFNFDEFYKNYIVKYKELWIVIGVIISIIALKVKK